MEWIEIISTLGFPIAAVIALAAFIYKIYTDMANDRDEAREQHKADMEAIQARCKVREDRLYEEIKEGREINGKFAAIIAQYDIKLDTIQKDIDEIKQDVSIIVNK